MAILAEIFAVVRNGLPYSIKQAGVPRVVHLRVHKHLVSNMSYDAAEQTRDTYSYRDSVCYLFHKDMVSKCYHVLHIF
jgi:hypothetical protein